MSRAARWNAAAVALAAVALAGVVGLRTAWVDDPLARLAAAPDGDRVRYTGSWYLPRGGPYYLGYESPGPAALAVDGQAVDQGAGIKSKWAVYPAGAHAVSFTAPAGARLMWEPVGRRGPSEYVPPSSLSPDPPDRARFDRPGTSSTDGVLALAAVAILAGLALFLARGALGRVDRATALTFAAVLALALAIRLVDLDGAGQTWDEDTNWSAGRNYVTNLLALDFRDASWRFNLEHPPVSKYLYGVGAQLADGYGPARATAALIMALACALLVPIGRRLFSLRAGGLAGLIAALTPHLIAHGKVVGHEAPTALGWALAIWLCLIAHDGLAARPDATRVLLRRFAVIGVVLGLALSTRFVNALLAPLIGGLLLMGAPPGGRRRTALIGLVIPLVALAVAVAIWPRLWHAPLDHLAESWRILRKPHGAEPFLGQMTSRPGPGYFALYLVATAPLGVVLAALGGAVDGIARRQRAWWFVLAWLVVPLGVMLSPVRQDGVRYLIPALLAVAVAAGAGLDALLAAFLDRLARRATPAWLRRVLPRTTAVVAPRLAELDPRHRRRVTGVGVAVVAVYLGVTCARIHPYYLDYYGEQVGGPGAVAAHRWFETAWWGEGLADAIAYLNQVAPPGARVHKACVEPSHLAWLRADLWPEARRIGDAEWILVYAPATRACAVPADATLVHEVAVQGAPLARVYRRAAAAR